MQYIILLAKRRWPTSMGSAIFCRLTAVRLKKGSMRILTIVGVRPNFIKEFAIGEACKKLGIEKVTVHTGQHYDQLMSDVFFQELGLESPKYHLELLKQNPIADISKMMEFLADVYALEKPDCIVTYGDVDSTLAASIVAARLKYPLAHIEAGVRGHLLTNPEEINRRVSDTVSQFLFPNIQESYDALIRENYEKSRVYFLGDLVMDSIQEICRRRGIEAVRGDYHVATIHRQENAENPDRLRAIVEAFVECGEKIIFPVHPRTRKRLKDFGLWETLENCAKIELRDAQSYGDFVELVAGCRKVISDSGGARREAYILGKPVISPIDIVWVPSMVQMGWELVADADKAKLIDGIRNFEPPANLHPPIFGDGHAAEKILTCLRQQLQGRQPTTVTSEKPQLARKQPKLSIVIPVFNEEESLPSLFSKLDMLYPSLKNHGYSDYEVVFVNDGSRDSSRSLLEVYSRENQNIRIVNHETNRGIGASLKTGFSASLGEIVVTIDADSNYDHLQIPNLLSQLTPDTQVVTASPFLKKGSWNYPWHRFVLSQGVVWMYRAVLLGRTQGIHTFTSGFRAYRREVLANVQPQANDFLITAEMLVRCLLAGYQVREFHAVIYERTHGRSKLRAFKTMLSHLRFMSLVLLGRLRSQVG